MGGPTARSGAAAAPASHRERDPSPGETRRGRLRRRLLPRSVRGRLVAVYTSAALVVGLVGALVFTFQLRAGLRTSLDAALEARAAPLVGELRQVGTPDFPEVGPPSAARPSPAPLDAITVVYRPDGSLAAASPPAVGPAVLPPEDLAAARTAPLHETRTVAGENVRLLATPVTRADGRWVVVVGTNESTAKEAVDQVDRGLIIAGPILLVAAVLGAWLLSGAALRPVERLRAEAEELGEHDTPGRLTEPATGDEIAALARTFNALLDRLNRSLARQHDLVADAGHELRTPLAVLRTELELADRPQRSRDELAEAVTHARDEVDRLSRLADDLLFLARADGGVVAERRPVDLAAILAEAARAARAAAAELHLRVDTPVTLEVTADAAGIRRAVDNLLANAIAATPPGGSVTLRARQLGADVEFSVTDTGPGFPPELLPGAFERFRRAEPSRFRGAEPSRASASGGAGLGLAIVAEIAAAHGGTVTATNVPRGGARVAVRLPRHL